ncbi:MAG: hypothetical protein BWY31_04510 [Lentisphaerae bacterium ADurb.Bin242]|nr:MAG: hypothetical protein BWY31_04510 [Lentisphaerae bacterium ADurb.Bin242]
MGEGIRVVRNPLFHLIVVSLPPEQVFGREIIGETGIRIPLQKAGVFFSQLFQFVEIIAHHFPGRAVNAVGIFPDQLVRILRGIVAEARHQVLLKTVESGVRQKKADGIIIEKITDMELCPELVIPGGAENVSEHVIADQRPREGGRVVIDEHRFRDFTPGGKFSVDFPVGRVVPCFGIIAPDVGEERRKVGGQFPARQSTGSGRDFGLFLAAVGEKTDQEIRVFLCKIRGGVVDQIIIEGAAGSLITGGQFFAFSAETETPADVVLGNVRHDIVSRSEFVSGQENIHVFRHGSAESGIGKTERQTVRALSVLVHPEELRIRLEIGLVFERGKRVRTLVQRMPVRDEGGEGVNAGDPPDAVELVGVHPHAAERKQTGRTPGNVPLRLENVAIDVRRNLVV